MRVIPVRAVGSPIRPIDAASDARWDDNTSSSSAEQERRRNNRLAKQQTSEYGDLHYLQSVRIIQRCLVYIIGLAPSLANEATLRSSTMFGQYGKIKKIILNSSAQLVEKLHSCCAYITFSSEQEALSCIMACDGCVMRGSQIRASFGTTKYCNFFLRGIRCTNTDCMYLHAMAAAEDCFTKREMQTRQAEFHARTHPCHAEAASTPAGEEVACLPPPRARTRSISGRHTSSVSLHSVTGIPAVFGDVEPIGDAWEQLNAPMECSKVPTTSWECLECLNGLHGLHSLHSTEKEGLYPRAAEEVDVGFLLRADDYLTRIRRQSSERVEQWNWRKACRSDSIDSDARVEG
ncbi:hypothetical protein BLSTO_05234 [Blastocystis sp. subtype 1]